MLTHTLWYKSHVRAKKEFDLWLWKNWYIASSYLFRYLDSVTANEDLENPKKVKAMQEKAQKEANKLQKNFKKIQKKADKNNERDQKMLDKELEKMGISSSEDQTDLYEDTSSNSNSSGSSSNAPKFSEITNSQSGSGTVKVGSKKLIGTVKKIYLKKSQAKMDHAANSDSNGAFTVSEIEDGKRSVRHLQGRRQSANILFVPKKIENNQDDFEESIFMDRQRQLFQQVWKIQISFIFLLAFFWIFIKFFCNLLASFCAFSYIALTFLGFFSFQRKSLAPGMTNGSSIFETGLGSIAFRKSMTASLFSFENDKNGKDNSIGSAGSLAEEEDYSNNEDNIPPFNAENFAPVAIFLAGLGMDNYVKTFREQEIDLETLTLLEDPELKEMGLPLGPRKKIMMAIEERRRTMKEEQVLEDSQLWRTFLYIFRAFYFH